MWVYPHRIQFFAICLCLSIAVILTRVAADESESSTEINLKEVKNLTEPPIIPQDESFEGHRQARRRLIEVRVGGLDPPPNGERRRIQIAPFISNPLNPARNEIYNLITRERTTANGNSNDNIRNEQSNENHESGRHPSDNVSNKQFGHVSSIYTDERLGDDDDDDWEVSGTITENGVAHHFGNRHRDPLINNDFDYFEEDFFLDPFYARKLGKNSNSENIETGRQHSVQPVVCDNGNNIIVYPNGLRSGVTCGNLPNGIQHMGIHVNNKDIQNPESPVNPVMSQTKQGISPIRPIPSLEINKRDDDDDVEDDDDEDDDDDDGYADEYDDEDDDDDDDSRRRRRPVIKRIIKQQVVRGGGGNKNKRRRYVTNYDGNNNSGQKQQRRNPNKVRRPQKNSKLGSKQKRRKLPNKNTNITPQKNSIRRRKRPSYRE